MVLNDALNSYQKAQLYDEMDPKRLIFMLYEGAIKRIKIAHKGVVENDPKLRGENLGKAIAIITELSASLDTTIDTEEVQFLKGLYTAMLIELPKVNVNNDVETLERAEKYLTELKRIWETTVMNNTSLQTEQTSSANTMKSAGPSNGYMAGGTHNTGTSFAV